MLLKTSKMTNELLSKITTEKMYLSTKIMTNEVAQHKNNDKKSRLVRKQ